MMKRYIPSSRSRSNIQSTSALRDQFIRDLTQEANALLKQLSDQFAQTLQAQAAQTFQGIVAGDQSTTPTTNQPGSIASIGSLLSLGARYLVSRPRTSNSSEETSRSIDAQSQFKLSSAQQMAEAQLAMNRGDKNL